jgi:hypothetical protein
MSKLFFTSIHYLNNSYDIKILSEFLMNQFYDTMPFFPQTKHLTKFFSNTQPRFIAIGHIDHFLEFANLPKCLGVSEDTRKQAPSTAAGRINYCRPVG